MTESAIWKPSAERISASQLTAFMQFAGKRAGRGFCGYSELHQWSIDARAEFWKAIWDFAGVQASVQASSVLEDGDAMPGASWFPGARLNFSENLLAQGKDADTAIIFRNEAGARRCLSFAELRSEVARIAAGMADMGITAGDRVAAFMPNVPETVIGMLAASRLGAIWSSCSPDFGSGGVIDRFGQIEPKLLIAPLGYVYNGKRHDSLDVVRQLQGALPSLQQTLLVPYPDDDGAALPDSCRWADFGQNLRTPEPVQLPFDQPLYIMYSSGTTGKPKCIVHGAGGTLLQHAKEHALHTDLTAADTLFYFTTCGWMMWNWLVSALGRGSSIVLFEGSPFQPSPSALFEICAEERVTVFGTSAKYLAAAEQAGVKPAEKLDLSPLKTLLSTGSPLLPENYDYVYRDIKADLALCSISGGTDLISCFALGNPNGAIYRGELQCLGLGMAVNVYDDAGQPLLGERGELVCNKAFPSMPVGFWGDDDGSRYNKAYFDRYPNCWHHGDYAEITPHGGLIIHGRSDATLNPGGVRIGTAELYRVVEQFEQVQEALAIGQNHEGDVRILLFLILRDSAQLDEALELQLRKTIRAELTPRHVPARIIAVPDLPRTLNGKLSELAVRAVIHGEKVTNRDALANPQALDYFTDLATQ